MEKLNKTILFVEDESITAMMQAKSLANEGFTVIGANTGEKAIEVVRSGGKIDLILMDIELGGGIDGTQAAKEILKDYDIPVLFLSSHTEKDIVDKIEKITSYGYVVKNTGIAVLTASIKMAFKLHQAHKELKEKDALVRESEERFRRITNAMVDAVTETDLSGIYRYVSPSNTKIFGYESEEMLGKSCFDFFHPDDVDPSMDVFIESINARSSCKVEFRFRHADGHYLWIECNGNIILNDKGVVDGIVFNSRNITERKQAEEALRKWAYIFEHAEWGVIVESTDGKILELMNPAFAKMHGYTVEELTGKSVLDVFAPEVRAELPEQFRIINESGHHVFESSHIRKDGSVFPVRIDSTAIKDDSGNILYRASNVQDITDRLSAEQAGKKAENARKESEEKYGRLFDNMLNGFILHEIISDENGAPVDYKYLEINPAGEKVLGLKREDIIGKTFSQLNPDAENLLINQYAQVASFGTHFESEFFDEKNNKYFRISTFSPKRGQFATIFEDISEQKQAAEKSKKYTEQLEELNATKEKFMSLLIKYS
ncbi:MAG: PAS domain S-box protein [Bacteroidales bacterium]